MKKLTCIFTVLFLAVFVNLHLAAEDHGHDHKAHDHDKDHKHGHLKAAHGGKVLEVGKHVAHIEVVHHKKEGSIILYILNKEGKALLIEKAPRLNLKYEDGKKKKQLVTKPVNEKEKKSSVFKAEDELLKSNGFTGKIALKIKGKSYRVELTHDHHKKNEHKGHDHDKDHKHGHDHKH